MVDPYHGILKIISAGRTMNRFRSTIVILVVMAACTAGLQAQSVTASIRGQVTDPSGAVVARAEVVVTNLENGASRLVTTDSEGNFAVLALWAGDYEIAVAKPGFKKLRRQGLRLAVAEHARVDLALELGEQTDEITVTVVAPPLEVDSATVGTVIPNNYIANLPLDRRNFLELALLAPGVAPSAQGSAGSERGRFAFHVNGAREDANAYIYDGVYAVDPVLNSFSLTPPVDAVREFRIHTSTTEATFGRNSGGQVSVALKRGANSFHGTVYEFLRNDTLDARNFFDHPARPTPKLRRNQFGFSVGGPLRRNSSFFFVDYEGLRERRAITRTANVPTEAERSGDFSASLSPPLDFTTGELFPDGRVPFVHPIGGAIADLYPLPNQGDFGRNFVAAPTERGRHDKFDVRIDQSLGRNGTLSGRYSFGDRDLFEPYAAAGFSSVPGYGNDVVERGQNLILSETHTLGDRWINEFRFGYNRVRSGSFQENMGRSINNLVGLPDFATRERDLGLSFITVTAFSPLGDEFNNPQDSTVDSHQILDSVSFAAGNHLLQFGFERRWVAQDAFRDVQSRGMINFSGAFTRNPLADLLLGFPTFTGGAVSDNPQALRTGSTGFFVHDRWRARSDLTLTLGLRYEYNTPAHDEFDAAAVYDPATGGISGVGTNGIPRAGYRADKNNFAPRVGLAWSPFGSRRTVLRAGYGIYHNFSPLAPGQGIYFNPPFFNFQLFFPSPAAPITLADPWPANQQAPVPPAAFTYDLDLRTSYAQQWSFTVQAEINPQVIIEAGYHGTRGTKLLGARDINQPAPSPQRPNLRPNPFFQSIDQIAAASDSIYHSFQTQMQCRFRGGLTGLFSYTWSKSTDNASSFFPSAADNNFPQDSNNVAAEQSLSSFDLRHRFSGSFVYELPWGEGKRFASDLQGWRKAFVSGWQINSIMMFQSGQPFTVRFPREVDNSNTGFSFLGGAADRPNLIGNPVLANPDPQRWFATEAFAAPPFGSFGNSGRNALTGPPLHNVNFSLLKETPLSETAKLQFRAEFFNAFNTPNFDQPNAVGESLFAEDDGVTGKALFGIPGFGSIPSAKRGREIQFGLKLLF